MTSSARPSPSQSEINSLAKAKGREAEASTGIYQSYIHIRVPGSMIPDIVLMTNREPEMEAAAKCGAKAILEYLGSIKAPKTPKKRKSKKDNNDE